MNKPFHKRSHGIFIATFRNTSANGRSDDPGTRQKHPVWTAGSDRGPAADEEGRTLNFGYYAHFAPVSHSEDEDPASDGYNTHVGYEADLLTALERMKGANLTFSRKPISLWDSIWLKPAGPEYDIVGGGITILDTRTRNAELRSCLDDKINYLTDARRIGYAEWREDSSVFMRRAEEWNESR